MANNRRVEYEIVLRDRITRRMNNVNNATNRTTRSFKALNAAIGLVSAGAMVALGKRAVEVAAKFESLNKAISFSSGSAYQAAENLRFLKDQSDALGLSYEAMAQGFKTFNGAMRGGRFNQEQIRQMFLKVSKAARVMQLSADDTRGVFLALGQVMSKGKVQAEELRGQIGERIPGAFQIAAKAMGVTTAELDKMMSQGKLLAEDFLPKFANQLDKEFAGGVEDATQSISSNLAKLENQWKTTLDNIGQSISNSGIIQKMTNLLKTINEDYDKSQFLKDFMKGRLGGSEAKNPFMIGGQQASGRELGRFAEAYYQQLDAVSNRVSELNKEYNKLSESERKFFELNKSFKFSNILQGLEREYTTFSKNLAVDDPVLDTLRNRIAYWKQLQSRWTDITTVENTQDEATAALGSLQKAKSDLATTITASSPKTININVEKQIGVENINTTTINESYEQVGASLERVLTEALAQAEQVSR